MSEYLDARSISTYKAILDADLIDFTDDFLCIGAWVKLTGKGIVILPYNLINDEMEAGLLTKVIPSSKPLSIVVDVAVRTKNASLSRETLCFPSH